MKHKSQPTQQAQFSIRVPGDLLTIIDEKASQQKRSRNQVVLLMLEKACLKRRRAGIDEAELQAVEKANECVVERTTEETIVQ